MMKKYLFLFCLVASANSYAQYFQWAGKTGGTTDDRINSIAVDSLGNTYSFGVFSGTADLDPGPTVFNAASLGEFDVFLTKTDASGMFYWTKVFGGSQNDVGYSVTLDDSGNIILTGSFRGTVDFDPGPGTFNLSSSGDYDIFVCKLNPAGDLVWAKKIGSIFSDIAYSVISDNAGNIYVAGSFAGFVDFDPGPGNTTLGSAGSYDGFVVKLDDGGNFQWAGSLGGTLFDEAYGIALNGNGQLFVTGIFSGTADLDPGTGMVNVNSTGNADAFISCTDLSGAFIWAKGFGGPEDDYSYFIQASSGRVVATGTFQSTADFNPGGSPQLRTSSGGFDIFISAFDSMGSFSGVAAIGGPDSDVGFSLALDANNILTATGYFENTVDFDPDSLSQFNLVSFGNWDAFVLRLDQNLNFLWVKSIGGFNDDIGLSIALDNVGDVCVAGSFEGTADFNPDSVIQFNLSSNGMTDGFICKLSQVTNLSLQPGEQDAVVFPNPNHGTFKINLSTPIFPFDGLKMYNALGKEVAGAFYKYRVDSKTMVVTADKLPAGFYTVCLQLNNSIITRKVLIQ